MDSYDAFRDYEHRVGRWWMLTGFALLLAVPTAICVRYDAWPPITWVLKGLLGVAPIYWTVGTIEVLTYVPMLGTGGSYLGFFTGNLTSLKVPCALNAMEAADVEPGTEAGEVISTIAIAVSALVTTAVIAIGVRQTRTEALFYFALAFAHSISAVMRGAGRAKMPMYTMLVCWCVIRVTYITLALKVWPDITTIFWAYPITWCLSCVVFLLYYLKADWVHSFQKMH